MEEIHLIKYKEKNKTKYFNGKGLNAIFLALVILSGKWRLNFHHNLELKGKYPLITLQNEFLKIYTYSKD